MKRINPAGDGRVVCGADTAFTGGDMLALLKAETTDRVPKAPTYCAVDEWP